MLRKLRKTGRSFWNTPVLFGGISTQRHAYVKGEEERGVQIMKNAMNYEAGWKERGERN